MNFELNFNNEQILGAVVEAFGEAGDKFGEEAQREITSPVWDFPQPGSDIVDLGNLRDSYTQVARANGTIFEHQWNARHAMANHEGARYRNGSTRPARPWTKEPIENFERNFAAIARVKLDRIR